MGRDKRWLVIGSDTMLARATSALRAVSDDVLISCRDARQVDAATARRLGARLVLDGDGGAGPLSGIASALREARHRHLVVAAVDMPYLSLGVLHLLARRAVDLDHAVVIRSSRAVEPLLAAYPRRAAELARELLASGERSVGAFAHALDAAVIGPDEWGAIDPLGATFVNWNRPSDLTDAVGAAEVPA
jgi:molybdopterin-guanine dinucleotide biosynthesis protein A